MIEFSGELAQTNHLSEQTHGDILDVSAEVYGELAIRHERDSDMVYRVGLCVWASQLMEEHLREKGHRVRQVYSPIWLIHYYVSLPSEQSGECVFIDATWQQFVPKELQTPELPTVLIGTGDEIIDTARACGVEERKIGVYLPGGTQFDDLPIVA